jgi:hypothetical protein
MEFDRTYVFYVKVGDPVTYSEKAAFEWKVTSKSINVALPGFKIGGKEFKIGGELDGFIDNPPPKDGPVEGEPDQFDPSHENPFPDAPHIGPKGTHALLMNGQRFARDTEALLAGISSKGEITDVEALVRHLDDNPTTFASVVLANRTRAPMVRGVLQRASSAEVRAVATRKKDDH